MHVVRVVQCLQCLPSGHRARANQRCDSGDATRFADRTVEAGREGQLPDGSDNEDEVVAVLLAQSACRNSANARTIAATANVESTRPR